MRAVAYKKALAALVVVICCLLLSSSGVCLASAAPPADLSKEDIAAAVEALRSRIEDFSVSYEAGAAQAPQDPNFLGARIHHSMVVKGDKAYIDRRYGAAADIDPTTFRREVSFNGERSTIHVVNMGDAMIETARPEETKVQSTHYFDLMLLNPPRPKGYGRVDQNLVSLLRYGGTRVRTRQQEVNGHYCHVLDVEHPQTQRRWMTVWLDCERGYLPMKQEYYAGQSDDERPFMEFEIEKAVELQDGFWFATRGAKRVSPGPQGGRWLYVHSIKVDGDADGKPELEVNSDVEDEFFDLFSRLPVGTDVWDKDVDVSWTVGGTEYEGLADRVDVLSDGMELPIAEEHGRVSSAKEPRLPPATADRIPTQTTLPASASVNWLVLGAVPLVGGVFGLLILVGLRHYRGRRGTGQ